MRFLISNIYDNLGNLIDGCVFHRHQQTVVVGNPVAGVVSTEVGGQGAGKVIIGRNRHRSLVYTCALNGPDGGIVLCCRHMLDDAIDELIKAR